MSLKLKPIKGRRRGRTGLVVTWDGSGPSKVKISDIAVVVCLNSRSVFDSIIELKRNADVAASVVAQVYAFLQGQKAEFVEKFDDYYGELLDIEDNEEPTPLEMWPNVASSGLTLQLAEALGFRIDELKVDFTEIDQVVVNRRTDLHQFDVCRERQSQVVARQTEVLAYEDRVRKAAGPLKKLEKAVAVYESAAKKWVQSDKGGAPIVEMLYTLSLIEHVTDVYKDVDPVGGFANNLTREMGELTLQTMESERRKALVKPLERLADLYFDASVIGPIAEYIAHWDASDRFHFYEIADQASGLPRFGDRLFHAIQKLASYAMEWKTFPEAAAKEVKSLHLQVEKIDSDPVAAAVVGADRTKVHHAMKTALGENGGGFLSVIGIWNGYVANVVGNFEGPPSVASLVLSHWASSKDFIPRIYSALTERNLKNTLLLIGITKTERERLVTWIGQGPAGQERARELFKSANWRGSSVFAVFGAFQTWTLLTHIKMLVEGNRSDAGAEIAKATISVVQDIGGLYLTGATVWHDIHVNNFLRDASRNISGRRLDAFFKTTSASNPMRVARMVHRSLASLAVVMAGWDLLETTDRRDAFESMFKITALGAAGLSMIGAFGSAGPLSALGPWGFLIGFAAGVGAVVYDTWIKSDFKKALAGLVSQVQDSKFNALYGAGIKLRAPDSTDPKICDGVCYFVSVSDPFLPWSKLVSLLASDVHTFAWDFGDALPVSAIPRLYRAGLRPSSIATMLERDVGKVRKKIEKGIASAPTFKVDHTLRITPAEPPAPEAIVWEPGASIEVSLVLSGRHEGRGPSFIWLEWVGDDDPKEILMPNDGTDPFNNYDPDKLAVVLTGHKISGFKGGELTPDIYRFTGHLYLRKAPPSESVVDLAGTKVRRARFEVMVPKPNAEEDELLDAVRPAAVLTHTLALPVRA